MIETSYWRSSRRRAPKSQSISTAGHCSCNLNSVTQIASRAARSTTSHEDATTLCVARIMRLRVTSSYSTMPLSASSVTTDITFPNELHVDCTELTCHRSLRRRSQLSRCNLAMCCSSESLLIYGPKGLNEKAKQTHRVHARRLTRVVPRVVWIVETRHQ